MNRIEDYINIKELVIDTVKDLNDRYAEDIFDYITVSGDKCGGLIGNLFEKGILRVAKRKAPNLDITHPTNDSVLGDVYSSILAHGIEVKTCAGWGKKNSTVWVQGTIQDNTKTFLLADVRVINGELVVKRVFYGDMSYKDWTIHMKRDLRIGPRKVSKLCKRII